MTAPYRLGFAAKVLGEGGLASADTRRWQSKPHLRRSIELLDHVFRYLDRIDARVYRMSSQVIPYGTHPDLPELDFRRQLDEAATELADLANQAQLLGLRLSTHPGQYTVLNARDDAIVAKAVADLEQDALLLDRLGQGPEGVVVIHVGGGYGDRATGLDRWARAWDRLSPRAQARLGLENDEHVYGLDDVIELHRRTGVRVVFDAHHHRVHPRGHRIPLDDALAAAVATWPAGVRPKVHLSSARTMLEPPAAAAQRGRPAADTRRREARRQQSSTGRHVPALRNHADLVTPWDLEAVVAAAPVPLDVMLEAKAKDLAVLYLRRALAAVRPEIATLEERRRS